MTPTSSRIAVVTDASVMVALCAREAGTYPVALAQMQLYERGNYVAYGPGVLVAEALFALCRKLQSGILTLPQHERATRHLRVRMRGILPPPGGDGALTWRAEQIRGTYGCSRSADGLYIALAEQLARTGPAELVTFDAGMQQQAAATAPIVTVRLLVAP
jgi:predicted nucleic acid-binding protein